MPRKVTYVRRGISLKGLNETPRLSMSLSKNDSGDIKATFLGIPGNADKMVDLAPLLCDLRIDFEDVLFRLSVPVISWQ